MRRVVLIMVGLALAGTVLAGTVLAADLPAPPRGYAWQSCIDIQGALLVPDGWHFRRLEADDGKLAYFVTKTPFHPPEPFDVGLTFNVLRDLPGQMGARPSEFARQFLGRIAETYPKARTWQTDLGSFNGHGAIYQASKEYTPYQFYNLVITNDRTGTAYLVIFEAPLADWEREWATIEPVIGKLAIDDEL